MTDDANGTRPSQHPAALERGLEGLAKETSERFADEEIWIERVDRRVRDIHGSLESFQKGETEWQKSVTRSLIQLTDQVNALTWARIVWPSFAVLAALFFGSFAAQILWKLTSH